MSVEGLEIYSATRFSTPLGTYDHPVAPGDRFPDGDGLQYTGSYNLIEPCLDTILPVKWNRNRCMVNNRLCSGIHHQPHGLASHQIQRLVVAGIECTGSIVFQQELMKLHTIRPRGCERQLSRRLCC